jgi:hypothetical protein
MVNKPVSSPVQVAKEVYDVDHVVVGAGICGLVMAQELIQQGKSYMCLEQTNEILGCWTTAANKTSHVAVSEPAFRFDYDHNGKYPSDFTIRDEFLADGRRYVAAHNISVTFNAKVTQVQQKGKGWTVTYKKDNTLQTVKSKGVFMALGAQQTPRTLTYPGEDIFEGTVSKGIQDDMPLNKFEGATVVIVGGGAFGCENLRTALMHGAEHVHLCYRKALQCWPRVSHYGGTLGGKVGDLAQPYHTACKWAGLELRTDDKPDGQVEPFMSRRSTAQPTASDVFFMAYKAGRLSLHNTVITTMKSRSVCLQNGEELPCDVLMKCLGWMDPPLKKVMPEFSVRKWVFLNNQASCAMVCDPHYQHVQGSNRTLNSLGELQVKGGTFSVLTLAHVAAKLQLHFMDNPQDFAKTMAQLPESEEVVCNWFQQKWEYEGVPTVNRIIDETLNTAKERTRQKFPTMAEYLAMAEEKCKSDCSRFLTRWPGYIFNKDGSGNFYDMPEDVKSNPAKAKQLQKKEETVQSTIQQNAYNPVRAQV